MDGVDIKVVPPNGCTMAEIVAEPNRYGSVVAFDYKLNAGFGCPSEDGNLRLQELQLHTLDSLLAYDGQCASVGGCDSTRITPVDYQTHLEALATGQVGAPGGWTATTVGGRAVLVRSQPVPGSSVQMRQYAEYCGQVRVENWIAMLGGANSQEADADSFFASISIVCPLGG